MAAVEVREIRLRARARIEDEHFVCGADAPTIHGSSALLRCLVAVFIPQAQVHRPRAGGAVRARRPAGVHEDDIGIARDVSGQVGQAEPM